MDTNPYTEFHTTQTTDPAGLLLPPGYISAIDPATGQVVAVRVADQPAPAPAPESTLEKALRLAREQPEPLPEQPPQPQPAQHPRYGEAVIWGSVAMLSTSTALWIASDALKNAAPDLAELPEVFRWTLYLVLGIVAGVVAVRLLLTTKTTQGGTSITALVHREAHTHIARQTGGFWKGQVNNKF